MIIFHKKNKPLCIESTAFFRCRCKDEKIKTPHPLASSFTMITELLSLTTFPFSEFAVRTISN